MAGVALGRDFVFRANATEVCPAGVTEVDALTGGLPLGCLTEICGPASSGRTSLMLAAMAVASGRGNICALVDASDAFDPASGAAAGVRLERLLWVRCGGNAEHALKAADLLVQSGGFGLVVMDLADTPVATARRISLTSWFRLRRAVEHTPTVLLVVEQQPLAKTCASLVLEMRRERTAWSGAPGCSRLLGGIEVRTARRKPVRPDQWGRPSFFVACPNTEPRASATGLAGSKNKGGLRGQATENDGLSHHKVDYVRSNACLG